DGETPSIARETRAVPFFHCIVPAKPAACLLRRFIHLRTQSKVKRRTAIHFTLGPDASAMTVYDAVHRCEANAGAGEIARLVQPLKSAEKLVGVLHVKAHAVIAHEKRTLPVGICFAELNAGLGLAAAEFPGVAQ